MPPEPMPTGPLRAWLGQTAHHRPQRRRPHRSIQPQLLQQILQPQLLQRPAAHLLHPHAARTPQLQRIHLDRLQVLRRGLHAHAAHVGFALQQALGHALGFLFQGGRHLGQQRPLAAEDLIEAAAQQGPVLTGDGEVAAEVEEGLLADLAGEAVGADEAKGEVSLAGGEAAGLGASDEHGRDPNRERRGGQDPPIRLWHYTHLPEPGINNLRVISGQIRGKIPPIGC